MWCSRGDTGPHAPFELPAVGHKLARFGILRRLVYGPLFPLTYTIDTCSKLKIGCARFFFTRLTLTRLL